MRGTIGGTPYNNLTPIDLVEMTSAYAAWLIKNNAAKKVVIGRDGRISGEIVSQIVMSTLRSMGIDVIDVGYSTTPSIEMLVPKENAGGGIILTASHNPKEWNALKLLNSKGEFISKKDGEDLLSMAEEKSFEFANVNNLGRLETRKEDFDFHIEKILALPYLNLDLIKSRKYKVVVDCINSTGSISIPPLLKKLDCEFVLINEQLTGEFAHNPEPVPENLKQLSEAVVTHKADLGIAVDPDVDRLVFVCEDGSMFSEEYTIVAVSEFILKHKPGHTVSNLSSTRALADITVAAGQKYYASAVGEVNVVEKMKAVNAVIGGEGNGGVILPDLHYGRDALVGIALMLNHLAEEEITLSTLKKRYPEYHIIKTKVQLSQGTDVDSLLNKLKNHYLEERINEEDGIKVDFADGWVHLRRSNTEPIIRIIAESKSIDEANKLIKNVQNIING